MAVSATKDFWIHPNALTITLNYFDDPQLIQTSMLAGSVILAYNKNYIGYDAAHNYREWKLQAFPTQLNDTCAYYVHAELSRDGDTAMIIYSPVKRDIEGRSFVDGAWDSTTSSASWFIYLGEISASVDADGATVERVWTDGLYTGTLATDQQRLEDAQGDWALMFQLNSATGLIDFLRTVSSATFNALTVAKNFIFGGHTFTSVASTEESGDEKKRNDATLPTTGYVQKEIEALDDHFLIKDGDDPQEVGGDVSFGGNISVAGEHSVGGSQSISGTQSVVGSQTIGRNQTIGCEQEVKGLQTLHEGFKTPNFNDAGGQVTGAQLTRDGLFSVAGLIANSFTIKELIYNVIRAQGGEYVYSPTVNIERCVYQMKDGRSLSPDEYYAEYTASDFANIDYVVLTLRDDELIHKGNPLEVGDIVYGYVNQIGESGQHATGGQCLMHVTAIDELEVTSVLYQVGDRGVVGNIPPTDGMTIAQRGTEGTDTSRMTSFYVSAESGSVIMLDKVQSPTLSAANYGASFGKLPKDLYSKFTEYFPYIQKTDPVTYSRYGIFENFLQLDHLGQPIQSENNRGEWVAPTFDDEGVQINPYRNLPSYYDAVTYNGALWKCVRDMTTEEPSNGNGWLLLVARGDDGTSIKIKGEKPSASELPNPPEDPSDCYIVGQDLYVWMPDTREWHNAGQFKGDKGDKGDDGKNGKDGLSYVANLMNNTNFAKIGDDGLPENWEDLSGDEETEISVEGNVLSVSKDNTATVYECAAQKVNNLSTDKWHTLSFDIKSGTEGVETRTLLKLNSIIDNEIYFDGANDSYATPSSGGGAHPEFYATSEWKSHYLTFKPTTTDVTIGFGMYARLSSRTILLSKIKLEVSNDQVTPINAKPTAWTLSENDLVGKDGKDGQDGKDAITFRAEPSALSVICDADRTKYIKDINGSQIRVFASTIDGDIDINSYEIEVSAEAGDIIPLYGKDGVSHIVHVLSYNNPANIQKEIKVTFKDNTTNAVLGYLSIPIIVSERGIAGPQGESGGMLLHRGNYDPKSVYKLGRNEDGSVFGYPIVHLPSEQGLGSYLTLKKDMEAVNADGYPIDANGNIIEANNTEYWKITPYQEQVFTKFLMANYAKFGSDKGAVFCDRYLFSQYGVNKNGEFVHYTGYDDVMWNEDGTLSGEFTPALAIDMYSGYVKANKIAETFAEYKYDYLQEGSSSSVNLYANEIDFNQTYNIKYSQRYEDVCLLTMPLAEDLDTNPPFKAQTDTAIDGLKSIVLNRANMNWERSYRATVYEEGLASGFTTFDIVGAAKSSLLLCATPKLFHPYTWYVDGGVIYNDELMRKGGGIDVGYFVVDGVMTNFLLIEPGMKAVLRSCRDTDGKLYWYVENGSDFVSMPYTVYVKMPKVYDSDSASLINVPTNISKWVNVGYEFEGYGAIKRHCFVSKSLYEIYEKIGGSMNVDIVSAAYDVDTLDDWSWEKCITSVSINSKHTDY